MKKILAKILNGTSDKNIDFLDLRKLILSFEFNERIKGAHFIYSKNGIMEIINIQPAAGGKAKPYQVKQLRNLIIRYKLNKGK
ncbi:MAG: type II toxin-antitoxin system HicA family toxin [Bacteroidetes bacterium]|nr:type II toxin-antitoxin system HicA family toxin [Bacteroidota bacterium]MBU1677334.1 type II toxin-antitoxin system HicA family toxin [Bacteroidota bacterium]